MAVTQIANKARNRLDSTIHKIPPGGEKKNPRIVNIELTMAVRTVYIRWGSQSVSIHAPRAGATFPFYTEQEAATPKGIIKSSPKMTVTRPREP